MAIEIKYTGSATVFVDDLFMFVILHTRSLTCILPTTLHCMSLVYTYDALGKTLTCIKNRHGFTGKIAWEDVYSKIPRKEILKALL